MKRLLQLLTAAALAAGLSCGGCGAGSNDEPSTESAVVPVRAPAAG